MCVKDREAWCAAVHGAVGTTRPLAALEGTGNGGLPGEQQWALGRCGWDFGGRRWHLGWEGNLGGGH